MAKETVVVAQVTEVDETCEDVIPSFTTNSDAILKPRIIWMDGFGAGKFNEVGNVDYANLVDASYAESRYLGFSSDDAYNVALNAAVAALFDANKSWIYSETGGRGGGSLVSNANAGGATLANGHWRGVNFPSDNTSRGGGAVIGLDLQNTILTGDLNLGNFGSALSTDAIVGGVSNDSHCIFAIDSTYHVKVKRFVGGDWTDILGTSAAVVPASGPFTLEFGLFLSTDANNGLTLVPQTNGFFFVRLYLPGGDPIGTTILSGLEVITAGFNASTIGGFLWGTDTRIISGTGGFSKGIDGIRFDGVVVYDSMGTVKRYLYDTRVGSLLPFGDGDNSQSIFSFGGNIHGVSARYQNVLNKTLAQPYVAPTYNGFGPNATDLYKFPVVKDSALDILAVQTFSNKVRWTNASPIPFYPSYGLAEENAFGPTVAGTHKPVVKYKGTLFFSSVGESSVGQWIGRPFFDQITIFATNPVSAIKWSPTDIPITQFGLQANGNDYFAVSLFGIDYVFRENIIIDIEHGPFAPICRIVQGAIADNSHTYTLVDGSIDWDGTIASQTWDLGDGSPIVTTATLTHTYATPGNYTVTHTVTDNDGLTSTATLALVVPNDLPVANFSFVTDPGDATNHTADFTDLSTDTDGTIVAWDWDFGDGSPHGTIQNPIHAYVAVGNYTVILTVTDNNGGQDSVSDTVSIPIGGFGDCTLSADALADTAFVQGDDFAGGNPPLPAYADTAAFDQYYTGIIFREAYDSASAAAGVDHRMNAGIMFHGHKTFQMDYGAGHFGAGWLSIYTNDASPEVYYTAAPFGPTGLWFRIIWNAGAGVMSDATATTAFTGLTVFDISGSNIEYALNVRADGHLWLDYNHRITSDGHAFQTDSSDLGAATDFVGRGDALFGELIGHYTRNLAGRTSRLKLWKGTACTLGAAVPAFDTGDIDSHIGTSGLSLNAELALNNAHQWMQRNFTPAGAIINLNIALWEMEPDSVNANPYGVGSP